MFKIKISINYKIFIKYQLFSCEDNFSKIYKKPILIIKVKCLNSNFRKIKNIFE